MTPSEFAQAQVDKAAANLAALTAQAKAKADKEAQAQAEQEISEAAYATALRAHVDDAVFHSESKPTLNREFISTQPESVQDLQAYGLTARVLAHPLSGVIRTTCEFSWNGTDYKTPSDLHRAVAKHIGIEISPRAFTSLLHAVASGLDVSDNNSMRFAVDDAIKATQAPSRDGLSMEHQWKLKAVLGEEIL